MSLPTPLAVLGAFQQFILCTLPGKLPVSPRTGQVGINAHDRQHHTNAATAYAAAARTGHAVAFVLTKDDPLFCLDIDGALQPDNTWSPIVYDVLSALPGSACEISQSGRGIHVWGLCHPMPEHGCKNVALGVELYHADRFICLGRPDATGDAVTDCSSVMPSVIARWFAPSATVSQTPADWTTGPCPEWRGPADDAELIRRMLSSRSNPFSGKASVQDLWTRNVEALARTYPSSTGDPYDGSSADMALATHLEFWTGRDC
jgi:primase-polymerase (primpol)-like protein